MKLVFSDLSWEQYVYWQQNDEKILRRLNDLIKEVQRTPFKGSGKPEPLKANLKGWWSRRITGEHRLVYRISGSGNKQQMEIAQCRYHY